MKFIYATQSSNHRGTVEARIYFGQLRWSYLLHRAQNLPWRVSAVAQDDFVPRVGLAPGGVVPSPLAPHVVMKDAEDNDTRVRFGLVLFG